MPAPVLTRVLLALLAVGHLGLTAASGQTPRPMGIVDQLNVPRLGDVQLSPDGREVLYTLGEADWKSGRRMSRTSGARKWTAGQPVQLTSGADGENAPRWSPDGKTIAFIAKRAGDESAQIYLLPADGGEARAVDDARDRGVAISRGRPTARRCTSRRRSRRPRRRRRARRRKDDVYRVRRELQAARTCGP